MAPSHSEEREIPVVRLPHVLFAGNSVKLTGAMHESIIRDTIGLPISVRKIAVSSFAETLLTRSLRQIHAP